MNQSLQRVLKTGLKVHRLHEEIAFAVSLLKEPLLIRPIFNCLYHKKIKERLLDICIRIMKRVSKEPPIIFRDLWEYKKEFKHAPISMDLIRLVQTYALRRYREFSMRELICPGDSRGNVFLGIVREIITN